MGREGEAGLEFGTFFMTSFVEVGVLFDGGKTSTKAAMMDMNFPLSVAP